MTSGDNTPNPPSDTADKAERPTSIRQALRARKPISLSQLAEKQKRARVFTMNDLERIMTEVIANILLGEDLEQLLDRESLEEHTRGELSRAMEQQQADRTEADRARVSLEKQVDQLRGELGRLGSELDEEMARESFLEPFRKMEDAFRAQVDELIADGAGSKTPEERAALKAKVVEAFESTLNQEKENILSASRNARDYTVERLERRIQKLNRALASTETSLTKLMEGQAPDEGVASIYRDVQGLRPEVKAYERKKELLKTLFVNNLRLRNREVRPDDLEGLEKDTLIDVPPAGDATADATRKKTT